MISASTLSPTSRFSNRAENYVKYRPGYPEELFTYLETNGLLKRGMRIADIGSGTGIFAEPLLKKGYEVVGIEPNNEMRLAGNARLGKYTNFHSYKNRAEATGLPDHSIDLVTVAQAFHWFEPEATRKEFARILKPGGNVALAWNLQLATSRFMKAYTSIKERYRLEPEANQHKELPAITGFFYPAPVSRLSFTNFQWLDFDGIKGQLLSSSCIPLPDHPSYDDMIAELIQVFVKENKEGLVKMEFETALYLGTL